MARVNLIRYCPALKLLHWLLSLLLIRVLNHLLMENSPPNVPNKMHWPVYKPLAPSHTHTIWRNWKPHWSPSQPATVIRPLSFACFNCCNKRHALSSYLNLENSLCRHTYIRFIRFVCVYVLGTARLDLLSAALPKSDKATMLSE